VTTTPERLTIACDFYKKLFGFETKPNIHLGADFWEHANLVTPEENDLLEKSFSKEEIKNAT
jgi:hypothetical protein